ncbi:MAG: HPF/RaiA family ribosome-associated protein [Candidatus Delongbacteria bacterium]
MKIQISARDLELNPELHGHIERRIQFGLGRFAPRVRQVKVRLTDENGPKGGEDLSCRLELVLTAGGSLIVSERDSQPRPAADRAVERMARQLARHLERERDTRKDLIEEGGAR